MADNLPLIPRKETVCADVKPVLREVFREMDQLPPILDKTSATDDEKQWLEKYNLECEKIWQQEGDLKKKFAKRISKKRAPNMYSLCKADNKQDEPQEKTMIDRMDLMPSIQENATGNTNLWIRNTLQGSSTDFSYKEKPVSFKMQHPLRTVDLDEHSRQTYSVGELVAWKPRTPPVEIEPQLPEYIFCVPEQINFVNFTQGHTHTRLLKLINISKFEVRLSVSLPKRDELKIELASSRGLRITAGSASDLKIHFTPNDVRTFHDQLRIGTSMGKGLVVPIACYMEPPELHIFVQRQDTCLFTCEEFIEHTLSENKGEVMDLGAKLLGNEHFAALVLQCNEAHAAFFLLTEDAWIDWDVEELTANGSLRTGAFTIHPAWWAGGGIARGTIRCSAPEPGVHSADIRILSSTAVTRMFHVVADAVYYDPSHITITAHDKDYDINSEDDPDCEYYVDLGTTFPGLSLSATVTIVNRSPIQYSFYWNLRPWRICSCWQEHLASSSYLELEEQMSDYLCPGAQCSKDAGEKLADHVKSDASISRVRSEPAEGTVRDRGACTVRVSVANVGSRNGTHRAVLQLILKDIPIESFQPGYVPNTVCKRVVKECGLNGKIFYRIVCDIVQAQMEVWWNVVPVRFVLDPPVLPLFHSRRVKSVEVSLCATQLYGVDHIATSWSSSAAMALPDHSHLSPESSIWAKMIVPLPSLPNTYPGTDIITLKADNYEWSANCHITRACTSRYPRITPPRHWLGVVVPGAHVTANIEVRNTTYQNICWWATPYRWTGENPPNTACAQAERTCSVCCERACTCSLIRPARGCLAEDQRSNIGYNVYAPTTDRIVATLVKVVRTEPDTAQVPGRPGCEARATLLAYRVLAPRLVMQVFPCDGNKKGHCKYKHFQGGVCDLDIGENSQGSAVLRPTKALSPCGRSCYKLRITNTTPIATSVKWEPPVDGEQFLKVKFLPNQFQIGRYNERIISVILEPRRMCERRLFVLRAQVAHAYKPLYLIIDTAIDGVRIICEVPLGGAERNDSFIALRRSQKELTPEEESRLPTSSEECFKAEDRKRAVVQENICDCKFELQYIPPVKPLRPPEATPSPTEIFKSRRLTFRNEGKVTAKWRMVVRYFPRQRNHAATIEALAVGGDRWAGDVLPPGVVIQCVPAKGICTAGQSIDIQVQVYADSWGLYFDQIMLMVDHVEPIVVDVWIEAVGPVLQFATASKSADQEFDSTMWLSTSDPDRMLRVKNISRSRLTVHAFMLLEHEHHQDSWPLRLYMEFTDVPKPTCPCVTYFSSDTSDVNNEASTHTVKEKMDTGFELYLAKDHGLQDNEYYTVEPKKCSSEPGEWMEWQVSLKPKYRGEIAPPGIVMLRTVPIDDRGDHWARWEPEPRRVGVREAPRAPSLRLSCKEVRVRLCALELDYNEVARVRKRFHMRNIGTAPLLVDCQTERPWQIVLNKPQNTCGDCGCIHELGDRTHQVQMNVEPWSSTAMCVEVSVYTVDFWPAVADEVDAVDKKCVLISYPSKQESVSHMTFTCNQEVLDKVTLILEVDFPQLFLEPEVIDFGFVTHGDTRKTYFSVWHSSLTATIDLGLTWHGSAKLRLYPRHFRVAPGERKRVYVQYNAVWTGAPIPVEGCIKVSAHAGAGAWCRCAMYVRAQPARDAKFHREVHDHTDMMTLWPPELPRL